MNNFEHRYETKLIVFVEGVTSFAVSTQKLISVFQHGSLDPVRDSPQRIVFLNGFSELLILLHYIYVILILGVAATSFQTSSFQFPLHLYGCLLVKMFYFQE